MYRFIPLIILLVCYNSIFSKNVEFNPNLPIENYLKQNDNRISKESLIKHLSEKNETAEYIKRIKSLNRKRGLLLSGTFLLEGGTLLYIYTPSENKYMSPAGIALGGAIAGFLASIEMNTKSNYYYHKAFLAHNQSLLEESEKILNNSELQIEIKNKNYYHGGLIINSGLPYLLAEDELCRKRVVLMQSFRYHGMLSILSGGPLLLAAGILAALGEDDEASTMLGASAGCFISGGGFLISRKIILKKTIKLYNKNRSKIRE